MTEAATRANFSAIRYAQCWEDADVLVSALDPLSGRSCLSIGSAGDNTLALLSRAPERVIAVDLNPAQLACLELRVAACRELDLGECLELLGSRPSVQRSNLYSRCRSQLSATAREFWDTRASEIARGIGSAGKFERYFQLFRTRILPWVHSKPRVEQLLAGGDRERRRQFYAEHWDTWRWRLLFRIFFSRLIMGRLGRDPAFFQYVQGSVAERILARTRYALTELDPAANPYLHWILTGTHGEALPYAWRPENFEAIRRHLDRLEWAQCTMEEYLDRNPAIRIDRFNLSDIFEYMSAVNYRALLERLLRASRPGARLVYWNMLVPRHRPEVLSARLRPLEQLVCELFAVDKAWFYSALVVEEVIA